MHWTIVSHPQIGLAWRISLMLGSANVDRTGMHQIVPAQHIKSTAWHALGMLQAGQKIQARVVVCVMFVELFDCLCLRRVQG